MRRLLFFVLLVVALPAVAAAALRIDAFDVHLRVERSGTLAVVETLTVTFITPHHGIERWIPVSYRNEATGANVTIGFRLDRIALDGGSVPYVSRRSGRSQYLRIGDPDRTIMGTHVYTIAYAVDRALLFHDDYIQLYWNVTGTDWEIPIRDVGATVELPDGVPSEEISTTSYVGYSGSTARAGGATLDPDGRLRFEAGPFSPGEGLTIDVAFPRAAAAIEPPTVWQRIGWFLAANWFAALPIVTFVGMFLHWYRSGRDPKKGTIAPSVEPPSGMHAGEAGVLIDDRADLRDISAMVIDLAVKGHLSIEEVRESTNAGAAERSADPSSRGNPDDYHFVRRSAPAANLAPAERAVLDAIFDAENPTERTLSSLENAFYRTLPTIKSRLYAGVIEKGYYPHNPERVRSTYAGLGMIGLFGGIAVGVVFSSLYLGIAVVLSGLAVLAFSPFMHRKTVKGVRALEEVLGLAEYISRAEVDRLEFHHADDSGPRTFEKLLPYAIALNLTSIWTRKFEGLLRESPAWYGAPGPAFRPMLFGIWLGRLSRDMEHTFSSAPRTTSGGGRSAWGGGARFGGGFSGGGFGGGGGRGW